MTTLTRFSNPELLTLPDCEGLLDNGKCRWLTVPACTGAGCAYLHKHSGQSRSCERLRSLDEVQQEHIAQKYYGGARPWMDPDTDTRR